MSKHTPGLWKLSGIEGYEDGSDPVILDEDEFPIATVEASPILNEWPKRYPEMRHWAEGADDGRTQRIRDREEYKANARLLALAPEMYELLEKIQAKGIYPQEVKLFAFAKEARKLINRIEEEK